MAGCGIHDPCAPLVGPVQQPHGHHLLLHCNIPLKKNEHKLLEVLPRGTAILMYKRCLTRVTSIWHGSHQTTDFTLLSVLVQANPAPFDIVNVYYDCLSSPRHIPLCAPITMLPPRFTPAALQLPIALPQRHFSFLLLYPSGTSASYCFTPAALRLPIALPQRHFGFLLLYPSGTSASYCFTPAALRLPIALPQRHFSFLLLYPSGTSASYCFTPAALQLPIALPQRHFSFLLLYPSGTSASYCFTPAALQLPIALPQRHFSFLLLYPSGTSASYCFTPAALQLPIALPQRHFSFLLLYPSGTSASYCFTPAALQLPIALPQRHFSFLLLYPSGTSASYCFTPAALQLPIALPLGHFSFLLLYPLGTSASYCFTPWALQLPIALPLGHFSFLLLYPLGTSASYCFTPWALQLPIALPLGHSRGNTPQSFSHAASTISHRTLAAFAKFSPTVRVNTSGAWLAEQKTQVATNSRLRCLHNSCLLRAVNDLIDRLKPELKTTLILNLNHDFAHTTLKISSASRAGHFHEALFMSTRYARFESPCFIRPRGYYPIGHTPLSSAGTISSIHTSAARGAGSAHCLLLIYIATHYYNRTALLRIKHISATRAPADGDQRRSGYLIFMYKVVMQAGQGNLKGEKTGERKEIKSVHRGWLRHWRRTGNFKATRGASLSYSEEKHNRIAGELMRVIEVRMERCWNEKAGKSQRKPPYHCLLCRAKLPQTVGVANGSCWNPLKGEKSLDPVGLSCSTLAGCPVESGWSLYTCRLSC
ncbi:hypothetical protein PR048_031984 [Dryococelus australis]|uniref:Uncharacterized protein n=1 Tax=Dryococelus australis TaxID=614101 RepID=A0ABQ9G6U1_9NEOP|nr:hypothetical protein PR048_031984 [Dryococelus australis]